MRIKVRIDPRGSYGSNTNDDDGMGGCAALKGQVDEGRGRQGRERRRPRDILIFTGNHHPPYILQRNI